MIERGARDEGSERWKRERRERTEGIGERGLEREHLVPLPPSVT